MRRLALVAALVLVTVYSAAPARAATQTGWPRTFTSQGAKVVVYQPQVRDWPNYTVLHGLVAVQVTRAGTTTGIYGAVNFQALTSADFSSGIVTLADFHVTSTNFPNEPAAISSQLDGIVRGIPLANNTVPLATVLASLARRRHCRNPSRSR